DADAEADDGDADAGVADDVGRLAALVDVGELGVVVERRRVERLDVLLRLAAERQAGADHRQAADADGRRQRAAGDEAPAVARGRLLLLLRLDRKSTRLHSSHVK